MTQQICFIFTLALLLGSIYISEAAAQPDPFAKPAENSKEASAKTIEPVQLVKRSETKTTVAEQEAKINAVLDSLVQLEFIDMPLDGLCEKIEQEFGIDVHLDAIGLDNYGISRDEAVSFTAKNISLRSGLKEILQPFDLVCYVRGGLLKINSKEGSEEERTTKVYDVTRWVTATDERGVLPSSVNSQALFDYARDTIPQHIQPETWEDMGGFASISQLTAGNKYLLLVTQSDDAHSAIEKLFERVGKHLNEGQAKESVPKKPDGETFVRVYPINTSLMQANDARKLIETVFKDEDWSNDQTYIKEIGFTVVIKQTVETHAQIYDLLEKLQLHAGSRTGMSNGFSSGPSSGPSSGNPASGGLF